MVSGRHSTKRTVVRPEWARSLPPCQGWFPPSGWFLCGKETNMSKQQASWVDYFHQIFSLPHRTIYRDAGDKALGRHKLGMSRFYQNDAVSKSRTFPKAFTLAHHLDFCIPISEVEKWDTLNQAQLKQDMTMNSCWAGDHFGIWLANGVAGWEINEDTFMCKTIASLQTINGLNMQKHQPCPT